MSKFTNPISGAAVIGLGGAMSTSIGAAIQKHKVHEETLTALVGGVITGALAGTFALCIPRTDEDSSTMFKMALGLIHASLSTAASLTAPLMGEVALHYGTQWKNIIVDELIGGGVMLAALTGTAAVLCLAASLCSCNVRLSQSRLSFFSNVASSESDPLRQPIVIAPPNPVSF